jgi:hypothetical protein
MPKLAVMHWALACDVIPRAVQRKGSSFFIGQIDEWVSATKTKVGKFQKYPTFVTADA